MKNPTVPRRGDLVWLDFDPQLGVEQASRRPAIVLTELAYNDKVGLCIVCPITSRAKSRPFEVTLPVDLLVQGVVLVDHVKSLDWYERNCEYIAAAPGILLDDVLDMLADLLVM